MTETLESLPVEMQLAIFVHLSVEDVARIAQTSRTLRDVVQANDGGKYFWKTWNKHQNVDNMPVRFGQNSIRVSQAWLGAVSYHQHVIRDACQFCYTRNNKLVIILPYGWMACAECRARKFVRAEYLEALRLDFSSEFSLPPAEIGHDEIALLERAFHCVPKHVAMQLAWKQHGRYLQRDVFDKMFDSLIELLVKHKLHEDMLLYYDSHTIWSRAFVRKWSSRVE